jgi:hypothetical protein
VVSTQLSTNWGNTQAADLEVEPVRIHFGKHQQVVRKPRQALRVLENNLEEPDAVLRIIEGASEQSLRKSLNGGQRRSQFVRNIGDEIAPHALEFA